MTTTKTLRPLILFGVCALAAALAVTAFAFRSRLTGAPLIGAWLAGAPPAAGAPALEESSTATAARDDQTERGGVSVDPRRQQLIGVRTVTVTRENVASTVRAVALVRYDERRLADVNLKLEGWIRDLHVDYTGQFVSKGQPLFTIYSPDVLTTEHEYVLALKTRDQVRSSQLPDAREYADRMVASSRQRLALWDLPAGQIEDLERTREPQTAVTFRSPVSGFVIDKQAVAGLHVMPGQSLYRIADLSVVWVDADVHENEIGAVRVGAPATVTVDALPGARFTGRATYVYPTVDERTRAIKVRFELPNRDGRLKPGMYANVEIAGAASSGLVVPTNAVLDSGAEQIVFVAQGDGYFEPRRVTIGRRLQDRIHILKGLEEGEAVATGATFFLDSESQVRASLQGYEPAPATRTSGAARQQLDIALRTQPNPPKVGDNVFEVTVKDANGKPLDDAEVTLQFFMPAMPTMNMPAMKNEVKLPGKGGGAYRGPGEIMMAGRWDATVLVTKGGQRIGSKSLPVVTR